MTRDLDAIRAAIAGGTMTQQLWDSLSAAERDATRDNSGLCQQLIGLEGWRVEVLAPDKSTVSGWKPRRFIVGKSTGWRPCHLAMRAGAHGSSQVLDEKTRFNSVRKMEKVRS